MVLRHKNNELQLQQGFVVKLPLTFSVNVNVIMPFNVNRQQQ